MGRLGASLVADEAAVEATGGTHTHRAEVLEPQLVVRESSVSAG